MEFSGVNISTLLAKTEHYDKDERYMATSDLCEVLKRQGDSIASGTNVGSGTGSNRMDVVTERKVCTAVLRLLHDKSNDVQAIAVKTLGVLLTTVQQEQVIEIADSLTDQVLDSSRSELRDVYAIGLRTLVKTIPVGMGNPVSQRLVQRLLEGIRGGSSGVLTNDAQEIVLACLDILTDLLGRFGSTAQSVTLQHEPILQMCLQQLQRHDTPCTSGTYHISSSITSASSNGAHAIRKRAGNTIGCLSTVLSDALLQRMVESVLQQIDQQSSVASSGGARGGAADVRALIRTMCTVAGTVGHRLGQAQIDRIIPIFLRFTKPEDAVNGDDNDDDLAATMYEHNNCNDDEAMRDKGINPLLLGGTDGASVQLANELRESCFMGFESFILRCPNQVELHLPKIIRAALAYLSFDPNYSYGDDDDQQEKGDPLDTVDSEGDEDYDNDEEEIDQEDEEDEEDDDDDESWKVRRSAIRALRAVIEMKKYDPAPTLWIASWKVRFTEVTVAAALVARFKEREENCRVGVIDCFARLLAVTIQASSSPISSSTMAGATSNISGGGVVQLSAASPDEEMDIDAAAIPIIYLRSEYTIKIVKASEKILSVRKGNDRSKSSALSLLSILCRAPGGVGGPTQIESVFNHVKNFLRLSSTAGDSSATALHREGTSKALRLDALQLVHSMLLASNVDTPQSYSLTHPKHIRRSLISTSLLPELCNAVQEQWYKVIAEALRALTEVPRFFTAIGYDETDDVTSREAEVDKVGGMLYVAIELLLASHDVDQEIKECALKACAALLSFLHASLSKEQTQRLLHLLLERLKNETTRIAAIKTVCSIATTATNETTLLTPIFADVVTTMASFLKLSSRSIQQSALEAIDKVVRTTSQGSSSDSLYQSVLAELAPLIDDKDLHLSHLSLRVSVSILHVSPLSGPAIKDHVLIPALELSISSLLQDPALDSLLALLKEIILQNAIDYNDLLAQLQNRLTDGITKHGVYSLAKCIASITAVTSSEKRQQYVSDIFLLLDGSPTPEDSRQLRKVQLALLISGDLGRLTDLNDMDSAANRLQAIYLRYFESSSEDLKHAASYAMGNASVGSPSTFLSAIVSELDRDESMKQKYLLLSSLREFIQSSARMVQTDDDERVAKILPVIVPPLERHCSDEEEGVRTMVAECMGSLAFLQPERMFVRLAELQLSHSAISVTDAFTVEDIDSKVNARVCWTVATSIKLAISGKVDSAQLAIYMPTFVQLLQVKELHCRIAALLMIYSATHHMPQVIASLLRDPIMPTLYEVAELKLERIVDLGPFKHTIDDALPLRKAALSIFATCLENLPGSLDIAQFMPSLAKAMNDMEDIQLHAHQILITMCSKHPSYVVSAIETFAGELEKLEKNLTKKQKAKQKSGTELERFNDWLKSALRVIITLSRLDGASSIRLAELVERVKNNSSYSALLQALDEEQ